MFKYYDAICVFFFLINVLVICLKTHSSVEGWLVFDWRSPVRSDEPLLTPVRSQTYMDQSQSPW